MTDCLSVGRQTVLHHPEKSTDFQVENVFLPLEQVRNLRKGRER